MASQDIEQLIFRVALRDKQAFTDLYHRTSAKLFGVCLRVLGDRAEAEDALQEVYVKIWRHAAKFAPSHYSPITWLVTVARNHAIDRLRARAPDAVALEETEDIRDEAPDPEREALAASERRRIDLCLDELAEAQSAAVRGAYLEGMSYRQLAERHDVPLNTMRTWLRRSLMRLRECLQR